MQTQLSWLLFLLILIGVLLVITELLHRKLKIKAEQSRKFLHVSAGGICLLLPSIFTSHWWVLALAAIAFIILLFTYSKKQLPSIHQTKRFTVGSIIFPVPVYLCFIIAEKTGDNLFYYLPVSLLAVSDTAAEIGGHLWGQKTKSFFKGQKTLAGLLSFFVTAVIVCSLWLIYMTGLPFTALLLPVIVIAACTAIAETVTLHGWDNLTVPIIAMLLLYLFV